jgi:hypothetical protein
VSKRTRQHAVEGPEIDSGGDEARLNLWAATGTLEASDVLAFRRGEADLVALEARHVALVAAINTATVLEPVVAAPDGDAHADAPAVATSVPRTNRWSEFRETG